MKFQKTNTQPNGSPGNDASRLAMSQPRQANRCLFSTSDARQCRMPRWETHAFLCLFHARQEQQLIDLDRVSADFRSLSGEFKTEGALNTRISTAPFPASASPGIPLQFPSPWCPGASVTRWW